MASFNLLEQVDQLLINWDAGIKAYRDGWGYNPKRPSAKEVIEILPDVLQDIEDHQNNYNIQMSNFDCNKMTNYVAWHILNRFGKQYPTAALFFGHFHFLDESIRTASLYKIPHLPLIAENLEKFHRNGHKLAPYTFIKGIDLTFTFCCGN